MTRGTVERRLSARLLGADARWQELVAAGVVFGVLPGWVDRAEPLPYFLVPGWLFYVAVRILSLLGNPRLPNLAFVLGVSHPLRCRVARHFLVRKTGELLVLLAIAGVAFFVTRAVISGSVAANAVLALNQALGLGAGTLLLSLLVYGLQLLLSRRPARGDRDLAGRGMAATRRGSRRNRLFWHVAGTIAAVAAAHRQRRVLLRRQVLYLLRTSVFTTVFAPAGVLLLSTAVVWLFRDAGSLMMMFLLLLACAFGLALWTEALSDAAGALRAGDCWWVGAGNLLMVNGLLLSAGALPYVVLYAAWQTAAGGESAALSLARIATFILCAVAMVLTMSFRLLEEHWTGVSLSVAGIAAGCMLCGMAVNYYGAIFPLAAIVLAVALNKEKLAEHLH